MKAWKGGEYPHKRVCPVLRRLIDKGGGPEFFYSSIKDAPGRASSGVFSIAGIMPLYRAANLDNQDLILVAEWGEAI